MSEEKAMSAKDIAVIIKACAQSGVRQLQYGDLSLTFELAEKEISNPVLVENLESIGFYENQDTLSASNKAPSKTPSTDYDDDDLLMMHVTDPSKWEEENTKSD